ncbi:preprotein translocase subunit SecE [candidate division KSB1 bacterium]
MIQKIKKFLSDVRFEMTKVSWPSFQELRGSTVVVIVVSIILSVYIFFVDFGLTKIMTFLLR